MPDVSREACEAPRGYATAAGGEFDCDDSRYVVNPGVDEICNDGFDNDCDSGPGECVMDGDVDLEDSGELLEGIDGADMAGSSVASAGDLDGDGVDELIVGAPRSGASNAGEVYVLSSVDRASLRAAEVTLSGSGVYAYAGASVAGGGDQNRDGVPDLLIGAPGAGDFFVGTRDGEGVVYVVAGRDLEDMSLDDATARLVGSDGGDAAGFSVAWAGDVTGDGYDDLLVGAPGYGGGDGAAYVVPGPIYGDAYLEDVGYRLTGSGGEAAGYSVSGAGDVDGDGQADLLVGAPEADGDYTNGGAVYVVYGPINRSRDLSSAGDRLLGTSANGGAGSSVASGDFDGDGVSDVLVGAPAHYETGDRTGAAYAVFGPVSDGLELSAADLVLVGEVEDDEAGFSVACAGDMDGDGQDEILVGAPGWDASWADDLGAVYLVYGGSRGQRTLSISHWVGYGTYGAAAGYSLSGAGDHDGDGVSDVVAGLPAHDAPSSSDSGAVGVVYGVGL